MAGTLSDGVSHLQGDNKEHKKIITGKKSQPDILVVRCKCMAEYRNVKDNYYNYDSLGEVATLTEAHQLYDDHIAQTSKDTP